MRIPALIFLCCSIVTAQDTRPREAESGKTGTSVDDARVDYFRSIADYFRNTETEVNSIYKKGIPEEEIPAVLMIARKSSATPDQVIQARKEGKEWAEIARRYKLPATEKDFVAEANIAFLSEYHGAKAEEVHKLREKGASFIAINQELRRTPGDSEDQKKQR